MMARAKAKAEAEAKKKMDSDPRLAEAKAKAEAKAEEAKAKAEAKAAELDEKHGLSAKADAAKSGAEAKAAEAKKAADIKLHGKVAQLFYDFDEDASGYLDGEPNAPRARTFPRFARARAERPPPQLRRRAARVHRGRGDRILRLAGAEVHTRGGLPSPGRDGDGRHPRRPGHP